jgi:hypothetical protein
MTPPVTDRTVSGPLLGPLPRTDTHSPVQTLLASKCANAAHFGTHSVAGHPRAVSSGDFLPAMEQSDRP